MKKWHYIEALSSLLIAGTGQIIHGESIKGLKIILCVYVAIPLAVFGALVINGYLFLLVLGMASLLGILVWGYSIWEALTYQT